MSSVPERPIFTEFGARPIIATVLPASRINVHRFQERSGSTDPASVDEPILIVRGANVTLPGILKELLPFLADYYPEACNKPVNVYGISNRRNHRTEEPIARLEFVGNLATITRFSPEPPGSRQSRS